MRSLLYLWCCIMFSGVAAAATYTAASCNLSAVQAAINQELATPADGDIISIPSGTCTWAGATEVTANFTTSVTIQGAGAISATAGGASTTGSDATVIYEDLTHSGGPAEALYIGTTAGKSFRLTGIAMFQNGSSTPTNSAMITIGGSSTSVRVDHCHFYMLLSAYDLFFSGTLNGVVDHVFFEGGNQYASGGVRFNNQTDGNRSWAIAEQFGTSNFMFVEDTQFNRHSLGDGHVGARYVLRHNTVRSGDNSAPYSSNHGIDPGGRSLKEAEVYQNTYTETLGPGVNQPTFALNGGTLLYWGNTVSGYVNAVGIDYTRKDGSTYNYGNPPSGWGNCSTTTGNGWDQRASPPSGYACLDQPGRGAGDLLSGSLPTVCNQTQGCSTYSGQWPRQSLSPVYVWGNTFTPASGYSTVGLIGLHTSLLADNRDYYQQFGANAEPGSFDGTRGVGQGLLSARPSTCTAGPGGNTPGVGYWATDQNTLYVCTATNTWTLSYTPYTYPHPLTGTTSPPPTVPAPPTNLVVTTH